MTAITQQLDINRPQDFQSYCPAVGNLQSRVLRAEYPDQELYPLIEKLIGFNLFDQLRKIEKQDILLLLKRSEIPDVEIKIFSRLLPFDMCKGPESFPYSIFHFSCKAVSSNGEKIDRIQLLFLDAGKHMNRRRFWTLLHIPKSEEKMPTIDLIAYPKCEAMLTGLLMCNHYRYVTPDNRVIQLTTEDHSRDLA